MIATVAFALLAANPCEPSWPLWNRYAGTFISGDGRVIDRTAGDRTTSEGQAYALFFSLVANDRALFQRLLAWTEQNLAQGDLARFLRPFSCFAQLTPLFVFARCSGRGRHL